MWCRAPPKSSCNLLSLLKSPAHEIAEMGCFIVRVKVAGHSMRAPKLQLASQHGCCFFHHPRLPWGHELAARFGTNLPVNAV